jgi:4-hydroxybenzoate polyprenyltransferase
LVVSISFFLSLTQYSYLESLYVAIAILAGQCAVGWTNDFLDYQLDTEASRLKKPLVSGKVSREQLRTAIFFALFLAIALSLIGPLRLIGTLVHAHNFVLKRTLFSVLPYMISFGALPWAIYLSADKHPPAWLYLGFIFFSTAFHFLNVLKDLDVDLAQGIHGLPQRMGRSQSMALAAILATAGFLCVLIR